MIDLDDHLAQARQAMADADGTDDLGSGFAAVQARSRHQRRRSSLVPAVIAVVVVVGAAALVGLRPDREALDVTSPATTPTTATPTTAAPTTVPAPLPVNSREAPGPAPEPLPGGAPFLNPQAEWEQSQPLRYTVRERYTYGEGEWFGPYDVTVEGRGYSERIVHVVDANTGLPATLPGELGDPRPAGFTIRDVYVTLIGLLEGCCPVSYSIATDLPANGVPSVIEFHLGPNFPKPHFRLEVSGFWVE